MKIFALIALVGSAMSIRLTGVEAPLAMKLKIGNELLRVDEQLNVDVAEIIKHLMKLGTDNSKKHKVPFKRENRSTFDKEEKE